VSNKPIPPSDEKTRQQTQRALYASLTCLGLALLCVAFLVALGPKVALYMSPALYAPLVVVLILLTAAGLLISLWGLWKARWRNWPLLLIALCALVLILALLFGF